MRPTIPFDIIRLVDDSYRRWMGHPLETPVSVRQCRLLWLHREARFGLMAHSAEVDPCFIYANRSAQGRFGYSMGELLRLPSRLSAPAESRGDRAAFLRALEEHGIAHGYSGIRVAKDGTTFRIHDCSVWELHDMHGRRRGQAALYRFEDDAGGETSA
ncbi:MAG TPA: MEKHLA domain-containing protein [Luteibacter sp.]|uniref:MEKHLA domain-containing protein n=1 Tax=Luteibacter sp. TaxID=1886636 RepID=UPI002CFDE8E9|nr:MEKHLA domain-containing protein [Luteibacter sp.]HVI56771.1 MEKHLA domain-containing protein [Luteibacter sp.]